MRCIQKPTLGGTHVFGGEVWECGSDPFQGSKPPWIDFRYKVGWDLLLIGERKFVCLYFKYNEMNRLVFWAFEIRLHQVDESNFTWGIWYGYFWKLSDCSYFWVPSDKGNQTYNVLYQLVTIQIMDWILGILSAFRWINIRVGGKRKGRAEYVCITYATSWS